MQRELTPKAAEGLFYDDILFLQSLRHGKPCHLPLHKGGLFPPDSNKKEYGQIYPYFFCFAAGKTCFIAGTPSYSFVVIGPRGRRDVDSLCSSSPQDFSCRPDGRQFASQTRKTLRQIVRRILNKQKTCRLAGFCLLVTRGRIRTRASGNNSISWYYLAARAYHILADMRSSTR